MSTKRVVYCYVTNKTGSTINFLTDNLIHGEFDSGGQAPLNTIPVNADNALLFHAHKTTGSSYGTEGTITYLLPDDSQLILGFMCPYTQQGSGFSQNNFFYAGISNIDQGATNYWLKVDVQMCDSDGNNCQPMKLDPPTNNQEIQAHVTIISA